MVRYPVSVPLPTDKHLTCQEWQKATDEVLFHVQLFFEKNILNLGQNKNERQWTRGPEREIWRHCFFGFPRISSSERENPMKYEGTKIIRNSDVD